MVAGHFLSSNDAPSRFACRDCGLVQRIPPLATGSVARCGRCDATLRRPGSQSLALPLACTVMAALCFAFALGLPWMDVRVVGRFAEATLFTGPAALRRRGATTLSIVVLVVLVVLPAVEIGILLAVLCGARIPRARPWVAWLFGCLETVAPWAMIEIFLLGVLIAYSRLRAWAQVSVEPSLVALGAVIVAVSAAKASLDRDALWASLDRRTADEENAHRARGARWIGCLRCARLVCTGDDGAPCPRCGHALWARKPNSIARTWALTIAAALLYIPANVLPVMTVERFGQGPPNTIWSGIEELAANHLWPLAILIFAASLVTPLLKLAVLATMLVLTHRRSAARLRGRTRLFRFVVVIGRWSMLDIFALTALAALVDMGFLATMLPGQGALAFAAVVILTMLAAGAFDPRLMWDAAEARGKAPSREPVRGTQGGPSILGTEAAS